MELWEVKFPWVQDSDSQKNTKVRGTCASAIWEMVPYDRALFMKQKTPVIFVIENNGYAMGTSVERSSNVTELHQLGEAYDIPSAAVDAMSVEAVHNAVTEAAARARRGDGPTLLEFRTYRKNMRLRKFSKKWT